MKTKLKLSFETETLKNGEQFLKLEEMKELVKLVYELKALSGDEELGEYFYSFLLMMNLHLFEKRFVDNMFGELLLKWIIKKKRLGMMLSLTQNGLLKDSLPLSIIFCEIGSRKKIINSFSINQLEPFESLFLEVEDLYDEEFLQLGIEMMRRQKK
jgi:hypothetical protein